MPSLPLNGFIVLDLTAHRAGPTAVRQLADWGADVIKIEPPGEQTDATGSRRDGPDFQNLHRNKRSITIDLKSKEGHALFMTMAKKADVIVENFKSTVKHRLGIDYDAVRKVNPRIVYGSISGFGQDGPYEGRPGVDQIAQGMGGLMSITGHPGQGPTRVGIAINDTSAGILLANGITLALLARERTGEGQWVHPHPPSPGTGMFKTADGYINIAASGDSLWKKFCEVAGDKDLTTNPDFATVVSRGKNRPALIAHLNDVVASKPSQFWIDELSKAGVPCGPINTIDQTFADPQVKHLKIRRPVDHPKLGTFDIIGQPIHMSAYPQPARLKPTPDQGQHTDEILAEFGYDPATIKGLHETGAV